MTESILEQSFGVTAVEPKSHFLAVGLEMFGADFVPCTDNSALQERKGALNGVGMNVSVNVGSEFVPDSFVFVAPESYSTSRSTILMEIVGVEKLRINTDVLADEFFESFRRHILRMEKAQFSLSLSNGDYDLFVGRTASTLSVGLSANIRFVHLDRSSEFFTFGLGHRGTDTMAEMPSRFVPADSKHPLNLASRNSFFRLAEDERRQKPFCQRKMRVIENRSGSHAELLLAIGTPEYRFPSLNADDLCLIALWAGDTIRPAERFEVLPALDFAIETRHKSRKVNTAIRKVRRHNQAPMKKKKRKTDREVLQQIFPQEIVREVDAIIDEVDRGPIARSKNPSDGTPLPKPLKPWGRKWVEKKSRRSE